MRLFKLWSRRFERVAFVAVKADMVRPSDIENKKLESLLRQMTIRVRRMLPKAKFGWFVCSACLFTCPGNCPRFLIGKPAHSSPEQRDMEFEVSGLPESWPENWQAGDYRFYRVYPDVPRNIQVPPRHFGLNKVFDFLTK